MKPLDLIANPRSELDFLAHVLETARNGTTGEQITSKDEAHDRLLVIHKLAQGSQLADRERTAVQSGLSL